MKNEEKIMNYLREKKDEITVSELAIGTNIDLSNIARYWKKLENKGLIISRPQQNGKIRTIYLSLNQGPSSTVIPKKIEKEIQVENKNPEIQVENLIQIENENSQLEIEKPLIIKTEIKKEKPELKQKGDRIAEILSTKKPKDSRNRKQGTDYYLKSLIIKSIEKYFQEFDSNIKISF